MASSRSTEVIDASEGPEIAVGSAAVAIVEFAEAVHGATGTTWYREIELELPVGLFVRLPRNWLDA